MLTLCISVLASQLFVGTAALSVPTIMTFAPAPQDAQVQPAEPPAEAEEVKPPAGPMRLELNAIGESRVRYAGEVPPNAPPSALGIQMKLMGDRLDQIIGLGQLVIEEMVDDQGNAYVNPEDITEETRTAVAPNRAAATVVEQGFWPMQAETKAPPRTASILAKVKGFINVVYAVGEPEEILIDNPTQFREGFLEHPRLKELGIKIGVRAPGDESNEAFGRGVAFDFGDFRKQVRRVEFYDGWMKPLYARERRMRGEDGQPLSFWGVSVGKLDEDSQMVLTFFPKTEQQTLTFELDDVELP